MIVKKAANMANMMDIPVLGLVENMSFVRCPDCGKEIKIFGESRIDAVAAEYSYPVLAKLAVDPALAALIDAGKIEEIEADPMSDAAKVIAKKFSK